MDIEKLKDQVRHLTDGSFDSAARAEGICEAINRLQSENEVVWLKLGIERARNEWLVTALSRIHGFLLPPGFVLPDGRRFEFSNPELERKMLRGLTEAIRAIPDEIENSKTQKPKEWQWTSKN